MTDPERAPDLEPPRQGRLKVFTYVHTERAVLYRSIMRVFMESKAHFSLHLRLEDIGRPLAPGTEEDSLRQALQQLTEWGNLEAHPDTADVVTVEDFYHRPWLYQLTPEGEAAERALAVYHASLERPGELQRAALDDIRSMLVELLREAGADALDSGKVNRILRGLVARFEELTQRAQMFIGSLQRTIDLQGIDLDDFIDYKEALIEYLERFVGELVLTTSKIVPLVEQLEAADPERWLEAAAERDLSDAALPTAAGRRQAIDDWRGRWQGLVSWFVGHRGRVPQAEMLRSRARAAIPALLLVVESIHDRRLTKSDRSTDLRTLARWFAETDSDPQAHRLWRAAFGLSSSRHLRIDAASLDRDDARPVAATTSWLEAPPLLLPVRLRKTGSYSRPGRVNKIIDRSREKAHLASLAAAEAEQIASARLQLARGGASMLLSEIGELDPQPFALFLDLLGAALARRIDPTETVAAVSTDGALTISLEPLDGNSLATVSTASGRLTGLDHKISIRPTFAQQVPQ